MEIKIDSDMIKMKNLNVGYSKDSPVLHDVNATLRAGSIYGLLGKNGSGKTTLLKTLSGVLFPKDGSVDVFGRSPAKRSSSTLMDMFYMPDEINMPALSTKAFVSSYTPFYPEFSCENFYSYLKTLDFDINVRLDKLSMGNRKKFLIAYALASGARFILMDEPTNGLDINSKKAFKRLLLSIDNTELIIVISTHLLHDIDELLSDVLILHDRQMLVNSSIDSIGQTFLFTSINLCDNPIFVDGLRAICLNEGNEDTDVDIELFYNALYEKEEFREVICETLLRKEALCLNQ